MFTKHQASLSIGRVKHYSFLYNRVCFLDFIAAIGKFYPYNFEWRMTGLGVNLPSRKLAINSKIVQLNVKSNDR